MTKKIKNKVSEFSKVCLLSKRLIFFSKNTKNPMNKSVISHSLENPITILHNAMKLSKFVCSLQMLTPAGLEAAGGSGLWRKRHNVWPGHLWKDSPRRCGDIRTQLRKLVSVGREPEAPSEGFPPREFISFSNDYNRNLRKLPIKPGMLWTPPSPGHLYPVGYLQGKGSCFSCRKRVWPN